MEDDASLVQGLAFTLEKEGFEVAACPTCKEAAVCIRNTDFELALLDIGLPDGSGFDLCRSIRKRGNTAIIFLTARDEETDVIMGLDLGGDDYITKPFRVNELLSRINAVLRRKHESGRTMLTAGDICLDIGAHKVRRDGRELNLSATEFKILRLFMSNIGITVTKEQLMEAVWSKDDHYVDGNTLAVYIRRLREKLDDDPAEPRYIKTVRGVGYRWE